MTCELPSFFDQREVTARKEHVCCECHKTIQKGERYQVAVGKWNGDFDTHKTCIPCAQLRDEMYNAAPHPEEGPAFGELREYIAEDDPRAYRFQGDVTR